MRTRQLPLVNPADQARTRACRATRIHAKTAGFMLHGQITVPIRFSDADPAGLLFYPRALTIAHDAVEAMIAHSALGRDDWFASPQHLAPLRRAEADFFHPLRPGDLVTVRSAVENLGSTSVTFRVDLLDPAGRICVTIRATHVLVDKTTGRPAPLPPPVRSALCAAS
jgi:acyl-CoA thioesterase FadM